MNMISFACNSVLVGVWREEKEGLACTHDVISVISNFFWSSIIHWNDFNEWATSIREEKQRLFFFLRMKISNFELNFNDFSKSRISIDVNGLDRNESFVVSFLLFSSSADQFVLVPSVKSSPTSCMCMCFLVPSFDHDKSEQRTSGGL